jgi:acyl carrier protein
MTVTLVAEDVVDGLAEIVSQLVGIPAEQVTVDASFADLDVDSLSMIEITLGIEERYGVHVPDEDAEHLTTVRDAVDYILRAGSTP